MARTEGVSFKSTSLKFPLEPFVAERPVYGEVKFASAISIATLASAGNNSRANATATYKKILALYYKVGTRDSKTSFILENIIINNREGLSNIQLVNCWNIHM